MCKISLLLCAALGAGVAEASTLLRPRPDLQALTGVARGPSAIAHVQILRGGGSPDAGGGQKLTATKKSSGGLLGYFICAAIITVWIGIATLVFAYNEGWPLAQSLFYAVDTGMSIGFGAVAEEKLSTKAFTVIHVLLGASAVGGAIALFAESVVEASPTLGALAAPASLWLANKSRALASPCARLAVRSPRNAPSLLRALLHTHPRSQHVAARTARSLG